MSARQELEGALAADRIMAILRYRSGGDVLGAVDGLTAGGVRVLEITVDTPGMWAALEVAADRPDLVVGAGTVTTVEQVRRVSDHGGRFVVSPGFDAEVVAAAHDLGLATLPGVATGTEVLAAAKAGVGLFKLFPAGPLGIDYLKALRGPFGTTSFVPTGGIGVDAVRSWLDAGALAVALGSDLAGRETPASATDVESLRLRAEAALRQAQTVTEARAF